MSDFNKYSQGNQRLQAELPTGAETTVRGSQLQRRNQSTFNPLEFNPNPQTSNDEGSKQRKKELQQQYRDQLDQMVAGNAVRKSSAKQVTEDYSKPYIGGSGKYQQPSNVEYERYQQGQEHHEQNENYNRQAYGQVPSSQGYGYGQNEAQTPTQSQNQRYRQQTPTHNPINWQPQEAKQSREQPLTYNRSSEDKNSFAQQDELREQLLAKIRTGYVHPNSNVYNSYQRAHEEREKHMKEFERNVVDKAAQEKIMREDQKAMTEWEKKKKLAWETNFANKRALEEKAAQKRRQQYDDMEADNRRVQDSLAQFERQEQAERERKKKLREENSKVLEQQRKDYIHRNNRLFGDEIPGQALTSNQRYGHGLSPEKKQREKQPLETRHQGQYNYQGEQDALTSAMENLNMKGYQGNDDYDQKYYQDQAYQQYARELAEREAPSQQYQDAPYQYQREQDVPEKYSRGKEPQSQHEIRQESPYSPQKQSSAKADYLKIREKARFGNNFNIISNEYK